MSEPAIPRSVRLGRRLLASQLIASAGVLVVMILATIWFTSTEVMVGNAQVAGATARSIALGAPARASASGGMATAELIDQVRTTQRAEKYAFIAVCSASGEVLTASGRVPEHLDCPTRASASDLAGLREDAATRTSFTVVDGLFLRRIPILRPDGSFAGSVTAGRFESYMRGRMLPMLPGIVLQYVVAGGLVTCIVMVLAILSRRKMYALSPEEVDSVVTERESLLAGMADGLIAVDASDRVTLLNDAAETLTGIPREELLGRRIDPDAFPEIASALDGPHGVERLVLIGESIILARVDATHDRGAERLLVLRDRSEVARVLEELDGAESMTEALRARNHEFSNTLQVISGLLHLREYDAALAFLLRQGRGGDILSGMGEDRIECVEVAGFLHAARARASELGISFGLDPDSRLPPLDATAAEARLATDIVTILGNFARNAFEACSEGDSVRIRVHTAAPREGSCAGSTITITIADDGPGVPESVRDAVFRSGVSSKESADPGAPGRGIGLALVARIAERYGGAAVALDTPKGASFEVVLNLPEEAGARAEDPASGASPPAPAPR